MALRDQPYFPLYIKDYLTDEKLLMCSWQTQGIYIRILCNLHKQDVYGAILFKQNSKQNVSIINYFASILCKLIACNVSDMEDAITELMNNNILMFDGEKLYQKRMYKDGCVSVRRSESAKKGGGNPALKSGSKSKNLFKQKHKQITANANANANANEDKDINKGDFEFSKFWELYDKKVNRSGAEKKWIKLKQEERDAIMLSVPAYVLSTPDKKYRKDPMTYLNNKSWNDEIVITNNSNNGKFNNGRTSNEILGIPENRTTTIPASAIAGWD